MEKALLIQIQTHGDSSEADSISRLLDEVGAVVPTGKWEVEENPAELWRNITIHSLDPAKTWEDLISKIRVDHTLARRLGSQWIVVCEGDDGWNDYKTLAHFDPHVALDSPLSDGDPAR